MTDDLQSRVQSALGPCCRIERELGGGMSRVFLADEEALGVEEKDQFLLAIGVSPGWFDPVRTDPRFVFGARRLGLDPALGVPALTH